MIIMERRPFDSGSKVATPVSQCRADPPSSAINSASRTIRDAGAVRCPLPLTDPGHITARRKSRYRPQSPISQLSNRAAQIRCSRVDPQNATVELP
jgi:hypothetical protein